MAESLFERTAIALDVAPDEWDERYQCTLINLQAEVCEAMAACPYDPSALADLAEAHRQLGDRMPRVHRLLAGPPDEVAS